MERRKVNTSRILVFAGLAAAVGVLPACSTGLSASNDAASATANSSATASPVPSAAASTPTPSQSASVPPPAAKAKKSKSAGATPKAVPTPMPSQVQQVPSQLTLDPGETAPKAGDGPTVSQIAAGDGKKVVKTGPFKQSLDGVDSYQTQYFIGNGNTQIGTVVIASGGQVGVAPDNDSLTAFGSYGKVEHQYGGTILRYQAGSSYMAMGYFGNRLITLAAGSSADLKGLYGYFKASA